MNIIRFKSTILILFCSVILTLIHSCKPESFGDSPIPEIELEAIEVLKHPVTNLDSLIIAVINYKDGDGVIGLSD